MALTAIRQLLNRAKRWREPAAGMQNGDRVRAVYRCVLDREPDPEGLAHWTAFLDGGGAYDKLLSGFVNSGEFRHRLAQSSAPSAPPPCAESTSEPQAPPSGPQAICGDRQLPVRVNDALHTSPDRR